MKIKTLVISLTLLTAGLIYPAITYGDNLTATPSTKLEKDIGSWNDELWQAYSFFQLVPSGGTGNYIYQQKTLSQLAFNMADYNKDNMAAVTPDVVVVEWHLTGHIHFVSGL